MAQNWKLIFFQLFFLTACQASANEYVVSLQKPEFELETYGLFNQSFNSNELPQPREFNLTYWGDTPSVEINHAGKSVLVTSNGSPAKVIFRYGKATKTILFNIQQNPATYSDNYILENQ